MYRPSVVSFPLLKICRVKLNNNKTKKRYWENMSGRSIQTKVNWMLQKNTLFTLKTNSIWLEWKREVAYRFEWRVGEKHIKKVIRYPSSKRERECMWEWRGGAEVKRNGSFHIECYILGAGEGKALGGGDSYILKSFTTTPFLRFILTNFLR